MSSDHDSRLAGSAPVVIDVRDVSKCYTVYQRPQDRLLQAIMPRLQSAARQGVRRYYDEFWAVRNLTFQVHQGQTVGIIGRNGSGKSTTLQIVCGTLAPTVGEVEVRGRIAALLELGTGFNPEFTGRENVYVNAAILGLDRSEVEKRFSDIALFADIGAHMDQPVKTYSSGMVVRLAFAVIAHVDADILVIDEALAVGDAVFTQKCMRYLREFRERGTVLFVSHDAASILNLCDHAIWLHEGRVRMQGPAKQVSEAYVEFTAQEVYGDRVKLAASRQESAPAPPVPARAPDPTHSVELFDNIANSEGWSSQSAKILSVELFDAHDAPLSVARGGERVRLRIRAQAFDALASPILGFFVKDRLGQSLFGEHTFTYRPGMAVEAGEVIEATFAFVLPMLPNGSYSMTVSIADGEPFNHVQHHWLHDAVILNVFSEQLRYGLVGIQFDDVVLDRIVR